MIFHKPKVSLYIRPVLKKLLIIIPLFCAATVQSQNIAYIDSLYQSIPSASNTEQFEIYKVLAWEYRKVQPDSTVFYCQQAITLSSKIEADSTLASIYNILGVAFHYKGNDALALDYYNQAKEAAIKNNDSTQYAHSLNNSGMLYLRQGDYLKAYDYYFQALDYFRSIGDLSGMAYTYKGLSDVYELDEKFDKALEFSQKAITIWQSINEIQNLIGSTIEHATIYLKNEDVDRAIYHFMQAEEYAKNIGDKQSLARIYIGLSSLYYNQMQYNKSFSTIELAKINLEDIDNQNLRTTYLITRGKAQYGMDRLDAAITSIQTALNESDGSDENILKIEGYLLLSKVYDQKGDYKRAYENYLKYHELTDKLNNIVTSKQVAQMEARMELDKKERENQILRENEEKNEDLIDRKNILNYVLLILTTVLVALVYFALSRRKRLIKANDELAEKNEQIAGQQEEISAQNQDINDTNIRLEKRNKELSDLNNEKDTLMNIVAHDLKTPLSQIKGLMSILNQIDSQAERDKLMMKVENATDNGMSLIRDILDVNALESNNNSISFQNIDLMNLLDNVVSEHQFDANKKGIKLLVEHEAVSLVIKSEKTYLERIANNLVSNALKFSPLDSEVIISSGKDKGFAYISIKDSGPGFTKSDQKIMYKKFTKLSAKPTGGEGSNGLGLAIIKTLVDQLGGKIELKTQEGAGSQFIVKFAP